MIGREKSSQWVIGLQSYASGVREAVTEPVL